MFPYQKLKNLQRGEEDEDEELVLARRSIISGGARGSRWGKRRWSWRRPKLRVAALLRRVVKGKAAAIRAALRASVEKMIKRLKEGRPYVGELFAGNYLFMQVNPSPALPYLSKSFSPASTKLLRNHIHGYAVTPKLSSS